MHISVIIPVYNRPAMAQRAISSVISQTYTDYELIIVDDGSDDKTPHVLEEISQKNPEKIRLIRIEQNHGVSAARNTGIRNANGEWIALLDSDDEWDPEKLTQQVSFHENHQELHISQCNEIWMRDGEFVNKRKIHRKKSGRFFIESLKLCLVSPSAVIFHSEVVNEIGYFDESFPVCEDYDYWLRVLNRFDIGLLDKNLLIRYGGHNDQLSSRYWGMDRWRVRAMEKHVNYKLPVEWRKALYRELIAKLEVLYQGALKRGKEEAETYLEKMQMYENKLDCPINV